MTEVTAGGSAQLAFTPAMFHIALALADGERHGYEIMQEIVAYADAGPGLRPGALYRALKRLLDAGLIAEVAQPPDPGSDDPRRRYYRLTDAGRWVAKAEVARMAHLVAVAQTKAL